MKFFHLVVVLFFILFELHQKIKEIIEIEFSSENELGVRNDLQEVGISYMVGTFI